MNRVTDPVRIFYMVLGVSFVVKLFLAAIMPVTGDEAYFVLWGRYPDLGYYDHPPMLGWWLAPMVRVSEALWWLRLPTIVVTSFIGWMIFRFWHGKPESGMLAATLFVIAPVNLVGVVIANDAPLLLFSFLASLCFYRAQQADHPGWYAAAGLLLGLAFLSKFFAGLLGVAFAVYVLIARPRALRAWVGLVIVAVLALSLAMINVYWNYHHCWDNYLFNLFNRNANTSLSAMRPVGFALLMLYLITPPLVYYLYRARGGLGQLVRQTPLGLFVVLLLFPLVLFVLFSIKRSVGLHWVWSFYPFLFLLLPAALDVRALNKTFYFMVPFSALHVLIAVSLSVMPTSVARHWPLEHQFIVLGVHTDKVLAALDELGSGSQDRVLATNNYTLSATLAYRARQRVIVFGSGSHHGRQDDLLTDFRALDGRSIVILGFDRQWVAHQATYFDTMSQHEVKVEGATYHIGLGRGFHYAAYRDTVLRSVKAGYYRIPAWLPAGRCYMDARYFGAQNETVDTNVVQP